MKNNQKCRYEIIDCDHNRREPADCVAADRSNVAVETVQHIPVGILIDLQPVGIHNLIEYIRLDIIIDINT